ncbi:DUF4394 domain-containing protein [Massilia niastensis]|uniref:DUF4394 domain-containing protein n=1 Tax=Massilia niastensis TaxID=544911 RepID=UPI000399DF7F|nr:DUF4394 domain-containing protein [Massilia niastensis]
MKKIAKIAVAAACAALSLPAMADDDSKDRWRPGCDTDDKRWQSGALRVIGLTDDMRLVCFSEHRPGNARSIGAISGLMRGDELVGIDFRVQDNRLYGVSRTGGVYVINLRNAVATKVNNLSVPLQGSAFGVDFNPAADRLRIVSDTGQNLRHNVNTGGVTVVDDPLDYPPATPVNAVGPAATQVTGSAYTNNDLSPLTATTLYALDTLLDQVALQSPPNDGTLAATGKLGSDAAPAVGFDIYSTVRAGVTVDVQALASLYSEEGNKLYSIKLSTGKATVRGAFPKQYKVIGIAIPLNQL